MKTFLLLAILLVPTVQVQMKAQTSASPDIPKGMKQYFIGFLVKTDQAPPPLPKEELDGLLARHLAYIRSQADAGKYAVAGPFLDDSHIRGMVIVKAATMDEAKLITNADPMIRSGRMAMEIHPMMMADLSCVLMEYEKKHPAQ